ncbi:hypothetical protein Ga0123462_2105 [Mariprofundus ferrinatatus]|uniref:DUF2802 domain-containing protein n=1 Tax=Mariprofundus ferrinatatus TaxID=1921087 RepID=A0A2K8L6K8_9PROT|nr:hypothetical protein [Mariprofundus ferrinatatus]ATX82940.1 hypothetical protein Ga0123462_2105 [Mariprofundus ferrinatatus]
MAEFASDALHYGMLLDLLLITAVAGLWLAWWRNLNRLKKTESLLVESIQQLDHASSQLQQAMAHIREFEKEKRSEKEVRSNRQPRSIPTPTANQSGDTLLVRTLLLQREGKSDEDIAGSLNIPIDQVRLMLKMHSTRGS